MKDIHPTYGPVVVRDQTSGETFLTRSTVVGTRTLPTITWTDGETYPVLDVEISSSSHPIWTGTARPIERGGQIEKFNKRYGRRSGAELDPGDGRRSGAELDPGDGRRSGAELDPGDGRRR